MGPLAFSSCIWNNKDFLLYLRERTEDDHFMHKTTVLRRWFDTTLEVSGKSMGYKGREQALKTHFQ